MPPEIFCYGLSTVGQVALGGDPENRCSLHVLRCRNAFGLARAAGNAYYHYPHGSPYRSLQIEPGGHTGPCGGDDDEHTHATPQNSRGAQH